MTDTSVIIIVLASIILLIISIISIILIILAPQTSSGSQPMPPISNNATVGAAGIGALYHFTSLPPAAEEASVMHNMGASIHKFRLDSSSNQSLLDFFKDDPSSKYIVGLNFSTLVMWAMPYIGEEGEGAMFKPIHYDTNYKELYDLAVYLRTNFGGGNKFFLGNWEADNAMWGYCPGDTNIPPTVPFSDVIGYFNIRQKAINDARAATPNSITEVYHYAEVNCVQTAMKGYDRIINKVIPFTNPIPDFISYSSYDSLWPQPIAQMLPPALNYLSQVLPLRSDGINRVFIGEYGFQEHPGHYTAPEVASQSNQVLIVSNNEKLIMSFYWAVYDNEGPVNGRYWLIDNNDQKKPVYAVLKEWIDGKN